MGRMGKDGTAVRQVAGPARIKPNHFCQNPRVFAVNRGYLGVEPRNLGPVGPGFGAGVAQGCQISGKSWDKSFAAQFPYMLWLSFDVHLFAVFGPVDNPQNVVFQGASEQDAVGLRPIFLLRTMISHGIQNSR